jgi:hypothetical protein
MQKIDLCPACERHGKCFFETNLLVCKKIAEEDKRLKAMNETKEIVAEEIGETLVGLFFTPEQLDTLQEVIDLGIRKSTGEDEITVERHREFLAVSQQVFESKMRSIGLFGR